MLGSERRSLLDGEISRREATAKDALDQFLGKLVDTFNFQIQEQQLEAAQQQQLEVMRDELTQQQEKQELKREAADSKAYVHMGPSPPSEMPSPRVRAPAETTSAFLLKKLSEKLSEFVLNESIDQAVKENPMELGWARSSLTSGAATTAQHRSSWFDGDQDHDDDDDDLFFQTDDESSMHCSYEMMPKSNITGRFSL
ncbi:hypothetical protein Gpo141_00005899 [Globisporangium polare]